MDTITHALIPVILTRLVAKRASWLGRWGLIAIGIAGALPDLLTPHITLESRLSSWSHGIPFWAVSAIGMILASICSRGRIHLKLSIVMTGAYLFHILSDAISGGVNFLCPYRDWIWGDYWVHPIVWIPCDIICMLACYLMFRILPVLRLRRQAEQITSADRLQPAISNPRPPYRPAAE